MAGPYTSKQVVNLAGSVITDTDMLAEGVTNKYFTEARVRAAVLTGLSTATATAILSTDTLIVALGKLQGQLNASSGIRLNELLNGTFRIWQQGTAGAIGSASSGYPSADMWRVTTTSGITGTLNKATTVAGSESTFGADYASLVFTGTGAAGSNISQRIEDVKRFGNKSVTVSFFAADSVATSLTVTARQNFGTGGSPSADVDTTSGAIAIGTALGGLLTATLALPSIAGKTFGSNNNSFLEIIFNTPTANAHTFLLAKVKTEINTIASSYEEPPLALEQAACHRYYWRSTDGTGDIIINNIATAAAQSVYLSVKFPIPMRIAPTCTITGAWNYFNASGLSIGIASRDAVRLTCISSAAGPFYCYNLGAGNYVSADARL